MIMQSRNVSRLETVAEGLGELNENVVYVGGAVAELYVTDPAKTDIRETMDIDCVTQLSSYGKLAELEELLRKKEFHNDTSPGAPICRWIYKDEVVDIMPDDENVIGFTNMWYHEALAAKEKRTLSNGINIYIFSLPYYVATKLEAIKDRGGDDWRWSHDFEDIIYILNYCPDFILTLQSVNVYLKKYLKEEFSNILSRRNITEEIECMLPYGEDDRTEYIIGVMNSIVDL